MKAEVSINYRPRYHPVMNETFWRSRSSSSISTSSSSHINDNNNSQSSGTSSGNRSLPSSLAAMDFKVESSDATNNNGVGISMPLIDTLQSPMDIQNLPNAVGMEVVDCGSEAVGNANLPILYVSSGYDPLETSAGSSQAANTSGLELEDSKLLLSDSHVSSTSISPVNEATLQIALTSSTSSHDHSNDIFYSASEDQNLVPLDLSSTSALNSSTSENKQDDLEPNTNPGPSLHNFYENFGSRLDETVEGVEQSHNEEIDASKIMVVEENNTHPMDENEQEEEMDVQVIDDEEPGPSIIMNPDNVTNRRAFTRSMGSVKKNQDEKLTVASKRQKSTPKKIRQLQTRDGRVSRRSYKCAVCGTVYQNPNKLKSHIMSHVAQMCNKSSGSKIRCQICRKLCKSRIGLTSHLRTHVNHESSNSESE